MNTTLKHEPIGLQVEQKHQFYSEKYDITLDVLEMSNREMYLNIEQLESLIPEKFDDYTHDQIKDAPQYRPTYPKATQYFNIYSYKTPEDFEKDMILEIDNEKWYSLSYLCPYIAKFDKELSRPLCNYLY